MSYQYTFADAKNSFVLKNVASQCPQGDDFKDEVNEAQRQLIRRGSFFGMESLVRICYRDNCVVWPRYVGTVEGMRFCDGTPAQVKNQWYAILAGIGQIGQQGYMGNSWNWSNTGWGFMGGNFTGVYYLQSTMQYTDYTPFYRKIYGCTGKYLRAYALKRADWGKTMTFFGKDWMGQPLQHRDSNGVWQPGLPLTLGDTISAGFVQTSTRIREVVSVTREMTEGNVMVYQWTPGEQTFPISISGAGTGDGDYTWNGTVYTDGGLNSISFDGTVWHILIDGDPGYDSLTDDIFGQWKLATATVASVPLPTVLPTNASSGEMIDCAVYEPSETNPRYRQSIVCGNIGKCQNVNGECVGQLEALVKLAYIPVVLDSDFLIVDNFDALAYQILSNRYARAGDAAKKLEYQTLAIQELNAELRTQFPNNETVVSVQCAPSAIRSPF